MAAPGRKPKNSKLRLIEGNREHRPIPDIPDSEPYKPKKPRISSWFTPEAAQEWDRKVDELYNLGLLTKLNHTLFETCCISFGEFKRLMKKKKISEALKWLKEYRMLCNEFGMSPAAIMKMPVKGSKDADDWGGLLD